MASVNKVILVGNLGAKPELKYLPSGQAVCEMRIATNDSWTKDGQKQEKVEWHRVVAWGKTGENCAQYLDKGRAVYVEGRLQTRTWDDKKTGEKRYATEIVAQAVQFLGGDGQRSRTGKESAPASGSGDDFGDATSGGDIPF